MWCSFNIPSKYKEKEVFHILYFVYDLESDADVLICENKRSVRRAMMIRDKAKHGCYKYQRSSHTKQHWCASPNRERRLWNQASLDERYAAHDRSIDAKDFGIS